GLSTQPCHTARDSAGALRDRPKGTTLCEIAGLVKIANVIHLYADIKARGSLLHLLFNGSPLLSSLRFALISLVMQITRPYTKYGFVPNLQAFQNFGMVCNRNHKVLALSPFLPNGASKNLVG
ncbi:MAG TPA: hypothetical protein V6C90_03075, partial [Coleofasciculaceae cyanobacterium]